MAQEAAAQDVWLIAFPEQVVGGYPAEDLVQWKAFVADVVLGSVPFETARCSSSFIHDDVGFQSTIFHADAQGIETTVRIVGSNRRRSASLRSSYPTRRL